MLDIDVVSNDNDDDQVSVSELFAMADHEHPNRSETPPRHCNNRLREVPRKSGGQIQAQP
jgi:hypothetical protein